jgi:hypothetical protein
MTGASPRDTTILTTIQPARPRFTVFDVTIVTSKTVIWDGDNPTVNSRLIVLFEMSDFKP